MCLRVVCRFNREMGKQNGTDSDQLEEKLVCNSKYILGCFRINTVVAQALVPHCPCSHPSFPAYLPCGLVQVTWLCQASGFSPEIWRYKMVVRLKWLMHETSLAEELAHKRSRNITCLLPSLYLIISIILTWFSLIE